MAQITPEVNLTPPEVQLAALFGGYRAEWLKEIYDLFTEPSYFSGLRDARPCMLIGGRGTGKTTVLRGLSYEGQFALSGKDPVTVRSWQFFGLYYRVNTNRVSAFRGSELSEDQWTRLFAHYLNIVLCSAILKCVQWYEETLTISDSVPKAAFHRLCTALHLPGVQTLPEAVALLSSARLEFESDINNVADHTFPRLSTQGVPIDVLTEALSESEVFKGKSFYFLLDEFENLEDYQQRVLNTLIKHSGDHYTFKVGVRDLGLRSRSTINANEQLTHPSDYSRISISESLSGSHFEAFALRVCNERLKRVTQSTGSGIIDVRQLLPRLTEEQEAVLLGVERRISGLREVLEPLLSKSGSPSMSPLEMYYLQTLAAKNGKSPESMLSIALSDRATWLRNFGNYKHSLLFSLNQGKRGIRRFYAGWSVFVQMAGVNIRYLLELVEQSLLLHLREGGDLGTPLDAEVQTTAAQSVGRKNLIELGGLSIHGAALTKLLLSLGRVFGRMAATPEGHAPEVNHFHLTAKNNPDDLAQQVNELLDAAVTHLVLIRWPGNKLGAETHTKDFDYMPHPIYSAYFVFSYRKKRKMMLSAEDLIGFVRSPPETIGDVLARTGRNTGELSEQLEIFRDFYADSE